MTPEEEDDDIVSFMTNEERRAQGRVFSSLDDDPEKGARAIQLAQATGLPPAVVHGDLDHYDAQTKARFSNQLITQNQFLRGYINSHDLASTISNDDLGQLDTASQSISKLSARSILSAMGTGFSEGYNYEGQVKEIKDLWNYVDGPGWKMALVGAAPVVGAGATIKHAMGVFTGAIYGTAAGVGEASKQITGSDAWGNRLTRDIIQLAQVGMSGQAGLHGMVSPKVKLDIADAARVARAADMYVTAGKEPPVGLHPFLDEMKEEQNKLDLGNLKEALKESEASKTKERSPELYAEFVRQHGDMKIGISPEAVMKLYGDKLPSADDNILGWVPKISEQLRTAAETGLDIEVPLADFLAKVDPKIAKELEDHIRVREEGVTKKEAKLLKEEQPEAPKEGEVPESPPTPVESVRQTAALQPVFDVFHGSPFEFTAFDFTKIGTGEGAQSYGHGGYFAEARKVGERYSNALGIKKAPNNLTPLEREAYMLAFDFRQQSNNLMQAKELLQESIKTARPESKSLYQRASELIDTIPGGLYRVRIKANKEHFLDWDRPLAEQPKNVQEVLIKKWALMKGIDVATATKAFMDIESSTASAPVGNLIKSLENMSTPQEISKYLREAGIPGIKYLDQGSRVVEPPAEPLARLLDIKNEEAPIKVAIDRGEATKEQMAKADALQAERDAIHKQMEEHAKAQETRNFVLFDASLAEITHKNDIPVVRAKAPIEKFRQDAEQIESRLPVVKEDSVRLWRGGRPGELGDATRFTNDLPGIALPFREAYKGDLSYVDVPKDVAQQYMQTGTAATGAEFVLPPELALKANLVAPFIETQEAPKSVRYRKPKQLELDLSSLDERDAFENAKAAGLTVDTYKRYLRLIEKQKLEDLDYATKKAIADEKRRQTDEWRTNEAAVRQDVVARLNARPDISADRFFRESKLGDEVLPEKPKLSTEFLTEEQQATLPKSFQSSRGMHPDDAAQLLGFDSGQSLISDLSALHQARQAAGGRQEEFFRKLIAAETEIEMSRKYGDLSANILREAQEQALSATQLDILHEEVLALGLWAGAEFPIKKGEVARWASDRFGGALAAGVDVDKFLAAAGKAGRAAETALLKGDAALAFREKQKQYLAITLAKEAKEFGKETDRFEKTAKRFASREVKGVDQEFTDYIQALMLDTGLPVKRSVQEIQAAGRGPLPEFVKSQEAAGWDLAVSDRVAAGGMPQFKNMTVAEFREFKDAVDSLAHVGKEQRTITLGEKKLAFEEFRKEVLENVRNLEPIQPEKQGRLRMRLDAELVKMEEVMKDLDLRKELGPLFNAVIRPMQESKALEYRMQGALEKRLSGIKGEFGKDWQKSLNDSISQDFLHDPYFTSPVLFDLSRQHMINIMMNFGNRSNIEKFVKGYIDRSLKGEDAKVAAADLEGKLRDLFHQHATKQDWEYVQHIWDIFEDWKSDADAMYRKLSGVAPKWIDVQPVSTPHGEFKGGYFPVIYDRLRSNLNVIEDRKSASGGTFGPNYFRATTGNKYTVERTGYTDFVQFDNSIEQVGARMQQMMHDIAFRPSVIEVSKVLYDKEIRSAVRKHYGMEYEAQLDPWLKDIANSFNFEEQKVGAVNAIARRARLNLIAHALPLNLKVIFSPSTGMTNPRVWLDSLMHRAEYVDLAHEKSLEIPNTMRSIDRDFRESLDRTIQAKGWKGVQADALKFFWSPMVKIEQGFRIATFVDAYKDGLSRGLSDADAIAVADGKLRSQHGAAGTPDLPAVMRSNEFMKIATTFYGWFNTMYNWQREIPGDLRRGDVKQAWSAAWGAVLVPAAFGMMFVKTEKDDSWFKMMGKALLSQPLGTVPFLREAGSMFIEGYKPTTPFGSILQAGYSAATDIKRAYQGKAVQKPITHAANVVGLGLGLPLAQIGRSAQFGADVATGKQRPKNILEWVRGIVQGEAVPKR